MVQKSKGGNKCRSSLAGKKSKGGMKHMRKDNYKKKKMNKIECCVCMEEIDDVRDNVVTCGKVNHPLCRDCKVKCDDCPMCRSHSVKPPVSQEVKIKVLSSSSKIENEFPKQQIKVALIAIGEDLYDPSEGVWSGIYYLFRKNSRNYPIYKMIDEERYIVNELSGSKKKYNFQWVFKRSPDNEYDKAWISRTGKLFGCQYWESWWDPDDYDNYIVRITRID